jgi:hypothetical protein
MGLPTVLSRSLRAPDAGRGLSPTSDAVHYHRREAMSEHFCYISASKDHANLGFYYGAELPDPEGLLGGTGKLLRHVRITRPEDVDRPALRRLVEAASVHRMPARTDG